MRRLLLLMMSALILLSVVAAPASASRPRIYHTITSTSAYAVVDQTIDCVRTEIFLNSSVASYASQPGPVNKQGLTSVFVRLTDPCTFRAAAGGGDPVLAEYGGQVMAPLQVDPRLRWASVTATVPDENDPTIVLQVSAQWTGVGELEQSRGHTHELYPGVGVYNSVGKDLRRAAEAEVSVEVDGRVDVVSAPATEAVLENVRWHCIEVPRSGIEGFYPCLGIPG